MSLEIEITALREAVERLAELPAAIDRLTQAVANHAATRLALFEKAGQEALAAIPLVPGENEAAALERMAVPFVEPAASVDPPWGVDPKAPTRTPVSLAEVQQVAREMVRSGQGPLLKESLVAGLGVGSIGQLTADQRIDFMEMALDAGWLPRTNPPETLPAAANQPLDEPPPAEVTPEEARTLARQLIEAKQGPLVRDVLLNQLRVKSLEDLTPAQRVDFVRRVHHAREAA